MLFATYKTHYKETIRLGIPIILGQLGIIVVGFADNIMVGHHSSNELAAASFVNNFFNLIFIAGMGFSYGLTPIIGNLFVQKEYAKAGETLKNSLFLNFLISIFLTFIMLFFLLHIEILKQPKELIPLIKPYYILQLVSLPLIMPFNSFKQFSEGITDTITPMWVILSSNLLNIIGNYLLIYGYLGFPELGLIGAGISTLFSRLISFLLFVILFMKHKRFKSYLSGFKKGFINFLDLKKLTQIGLPIAALMAVETGSFSLSVIMMGWLGSTALAAHQIISVITTLGFMIYYGIGAAITIRVSSFRGKNDWKNIRNATFAGLHLIMITAFFVVLLIVSFRDSMGYIFTSQKEVVELVSLLAWSVILYQFGDGLQVTFVNALRGIADVKKMAYIACFCHLGLALPIGYSCGFILDWGAFGIWCGFPVSLTTLGILLWKRFNVLTIKQCHI